MSFCVVLEIYLEQYAKHSPKVDFWRNIIEFFFFHSQTKQFFFGLRFRVGVDTNRIVDELFGLEFDESIFEFGIVRTRIEYKFKLRFVYFSNTNSNWMV